MVKVARFALARWMADHEGTGEHDLSESCCAPMSIKELQSLSSDSSAPPISVDEIQGYGPLRGSEKLRTNVAALYSGGNLSAKDVLITPGSIQANFLVMYALIAPGDHVICHYPTFQQLYAVPESLGASITLWRAREDKGWSLDVDELEKMITPKTRLIVINNPNNPTGGYVPKSDMEKIIKIASAKSIYVLSDEVFAPIFHSFGEGDEVPPSAVTLGYERTIVTGSTTKAFSLAGLRIGWIATANAQVLERCCEARDYTTISCSIISDNLAAYALSKGTVVNILKRNLALAKKNVQIMDDFVKKYPGKISWVRPKAGTTAFVCFYKDGKPVEDDKFCEDVTAKCGAYFCPGKFCFGNSVDFQGYTRIGYVCSTEVLVKGLEALGKYIEQEL